MIQKKLIYITIGYELAKIAYEFKKLNASRIKFELNKRVGQFSIYIDDTIYKNFDGGVGIRMTKMVLSQFLKSKKKNSDEKIDNIKITKNDFNFTFLPLPKGKCLCYKHKNKSGGIFEAIIEVKSSLPSEILKEKLEELSANTEQFEVFCIIEGGKENVEGVNYNKNIIYFESGNKLHIPDEAKSNKRKMKEFFNQFKTKAKKTI